MPPATGPRSWPRPATVFDESGVDVCVETIAQRAGVGVGTLYRRFPTKELLIEAVVDEVLRGVLSAADAGPGQRVAGQRVRRVHPGGGPAPVRARRLPDPAVEQLARRRCATRSRRRAGRCCRGPRPRGGAPGSGLRGRDRPVLVAARCHRGHGDGLTRRLAPTPRSAAHLAGARTTDASSIRRSPPCRSSGPGPRRPCTTAAGPDLVPSRPRPGGAAAARARSPARRR